MYFCEMFVCFLLCSIFTYTVAFTKDYTYLDICSKHYSRKLYVEYGTSGVLLADYSTGSSRNNNNNNGGYKEGNCSVDFITCPYCIIEIQFKFLNISRTCDKTLSFSECSCDYVLIHEPPFKDASGEQFCGRFLQNNNVSGLGYLSRTRFATVDFVFTRNYGHAFTLKFTAKRNRWIFEGYPKLDHMNNMTQIVMSPFFPHLYPTDLSTEYVIECHSQDLCRISLIFTDFLIAESSILEFFDWNGQRMYVISGNIFRPPVILTSGPSLTIRFYANGATNLGFKASYSFMLGSLDAKAFEPNLGCGGEINNLGGGITMMDMVSDKPEFFDCIWIIRPPVHFLHRKTHLYVKVANFSDFAGMTEMVLRQGLTSSEPAVEVFRYPLSRFNAMDEKEHVVPINQGFYINLRGLFKPQSRVALVYAAFNYKECFSGLDFLCHNMRCISTLLNCDGFDHCGDNSDESPDCSQDPRDHREYSKIPNFLFPKVESYGDLTTVTFIFFTCTFGLIGVIFAMALVLYRLNTRARHQRCIEDHMETIHAILEEGMPDLEEEIHIHDEPPDYEPPPEYSDVFKYFRKIGWGGNTHKQRSNPELSPLKAHVCKENLTELNVASSSRSCQTTPVKIPRSPPPAYDNNGLELENIPGSSKDVDANENTSCLPVRTLNSTDVTLPDVTTCQSTASSRFLNFREKKFRKSLSQPNLPIYFENSVENGMGNLRKCYSAVSSRFWTFHSIENSVKSVSHPNIDLCFENFTKNRRGISRKCYSADEVTSI
ncbi:uncharacterized protein LOC115891900 [Sitophilus oryzae]|uniref:Uncharacterized protein LOC115891900 n=1 Tax=Sitophilus oryzae TaxID=7048 RepID=A0A6J2YYR9_SITOR|nr:uncharacterized protein LOC115891900 [Sitophilus oryzae]